MINILSSIKNLYVVVYKNHNDILTIAFDALYETKSEAFKAIKYLVSDIYDFPENLYVCKFK